tara:strand:- start:399 stop:1085 length:687 start_codon:yes stop_codon:yes gene_type:complete
MVPVGELPLLAINPADVGACRLQLNDGGVPPLRSPTEAVGSDGPNLFGELGRTILELGKGALEDLTGVAKGGAKAGDRLVNEAEFSCTVNRKSLLCDGVAVHENSSRTPVVCQLVDTHKLEMAFSKAWTKLWPSNSLTRFGQLRNSDGFPRSVSVPSSHWMAVLVGAAGQMEAAYVCELHIKEFSFDKPTGNTSVRINCRIAGVERIRDTEGLQRAKERAKLRAPGPR